MKSSMDYKRLEKILKKHYGNSKTIFIDVGRRRSRIFQKESKDYGTIRLIKNGEKTKNFYGYIVGVRKHDNKIDVVVNYNGLRRNIIIYEETVTNLDRLFKLLANKGGLLKSLIEKNLVVDRLTEEKKAEEKIGSLGSLFG